MRIPHCKGKKERRRRRERKRRILDQEAKRPHFQLVYRIGADGKPIDEVKPDRPPITMGSTLLAPWEDPPEVPMNGAHKKAP